MNILIAVTREELDCFHEVREQYTLTHAQALAALNHFGARAKIAPFNAYTAAHNACAQQTHPNRG